MEGMLYGIIVSFIYGCYSVREYFYEGNSARLAAEAAKKKREQRRAQMSKGRAKKKITVKQIEKKEKEEELKIDSRPDELTEWDKIKMDNPELKDIIGEPKEKEEPGAVEEKEEKK